MNTKVKSVKIKKNVILKEFIVEKYGSIAKFTKKENVPRTDVDIMLQKAEIFNEIHIGMKVCKALNIDPEELFFKGRILVNPEDSDNVIYENMSKDEIIKEKCEKLDAQEQRKILDFINQILEN